MAHTPDVEMDEITAMRFGMICAMEDLKWREVEPPIKGERCFVSPDDESVQFSMARDGYTQWAFGRDDINAPEVNYRTFAEGDTWKEFERALLLARIATEATARKRENLAGEWWDALTPNERFLWFIKSDVHWRPPAVGYTTAWNTLVSPERENVVRQILAGVTK